MRSSKSVPIILCDHCMSETPTSKLITLKLMEDGRQNFDFGDLHFDKSQCLIDYVDAHLVLEGPGNRVHTISSLIIERQGE